VAAGELDDAGAAMIDRTELLRLANELGLEARVVEKDYVLGWVLAGIARDPALVSAWVFKGGTCLKKCFFETYRFSEDLDFTVPIRLSSRSASSSSGSPLSAPGSTTRPASSCRRT
jgi:hypothetical protein